MPTLTHRKFLAVQDRFFREVQQSPATVTLNLITATSDGDFSDFTGDSTRESESHTVKCLYKRNFTKSTRIKYGLEETEDGVIYLTPRHVYEATGGDWRLDFTTTTFTFQGREYICSKIIFEEELYGSCIALICILTDKDKGG